MQSLFVAVWCNFFFDNSKGCEKYHLTEYRYLGDMMTGESAAFESFTNYYILG